MVRLTLPPAVLLAPIIETVRLSGLIAPQCALLLVSGCYAEPVAITNFAPQERATPTPVLPTAWPEATATASRTPLPSPTPTPVAAVATPSAGCANGWLGPLPGSAEHDEGLAILEGHMGVVGPWSVADMRYFTGPDSPGVIEPRFQVVERWYIRAALAGDPGYRGRWLIEKRTDQILGVSAVAPWDSVGYASPSWKGFIGEGPPRTYTGLPGRWSGIPFDFVTGEGDGGQPGLPAQVVDCLAGT